MNDMPPSIRPVLQRLARRLAVGLFLDIWPKWAVGSLLVAGTATVVCRLFVAALAPALPWLWLAPVAAAIPALAVCVRRSYSQAHLLAIADTLSGGSGTLLTMAERGDAGWYGSSLFSRASAIALPRLRPWRRLAPILPALAFLAFTLSLPQRTAAAPGRLGDEVVGDLQATIAQLQQQALVTPEEQKSLEEEIAQIKRAAQERMDASTWEAADAMREKMASSMAAKDDAAKWAEESLARAAASVQAGAVDPSGAGASNADMQELAKALEKLLQSGMLAGAPNELLELAASAAKGLPMDAAALAEFAGELSEFLGEQRGRLAALRRSADGGRRFDPEEFEADAAGDSGGIPGRGGINRGRADAELTWGEESQPLERFKPQPLPPGAMRSADDLAPVVTLPGAPKEAPVAGTLSAARAYSETPGQAAWRRTLAPRHRSAVKKYFESERK